MRILPYFATTLLFASAALAAPVDSAHIPASADWFLHVDLDKLAQGKMADLLKELDKDKGADNPLRFFEIQDGRASGGFTLYGSVSDPEDVVLLMQGLTDQDELIKEVSKSGKYETSEHGDHTIHSWVEKDGKRGKNKHRVYMTFVDEVSALISGGESALEEALDFHAKGGNPHGEKLGDGAIVGHVDVDAILKEVDPEAAVFDLASEIDFSVQLNKDEELVGVIQLTSKDEDRAKRLSRMIDGMVAFASEAAEHEGLWTPDENFEIEQKGDSIEVKFTIPVKELKKMFFDRDLII